MTDVEFAQSILAPALYGRDVTDPEVQQDLAQRGLQGSRDWMCFAMLYEVRAEGVFVSDMKSGTVLRSVLWADLAHQATLDLGVSP